MKYLAILLTVHNRKEQTLECLRRIYYLNNTPECSFDIYLTDDGCTDGTSEAVHKLFPKVHIIQGNGNLFWNRGMWTAWNEAAKNDYDFYLWLNDDTFVFPCILQSLLDASEIKQNQSIIVGATTDNRHISITYGGYDSTNKRIQPNGKLQTVHSFNGNIVLVPRSVYHVLGNLDYYFTHSNGDIDYGLRAAKAGINCYLAKTVLGECNRHNSLDRWCNPKVPFKERWKMLYKPNGMPPNEKFYLQRRHKSIYVAAFHWLTIHLRCIFPQLWIKRT